jgi:hypothetical protein
VTNVIIRYPCAVSRRSFTDEGAAAQAHDARARQLHGSAAQLNFPGEASDRHHTGSGRDTVK